jgi:hypothetical protein
VFEFKLRAGGSVEDAIQQIDDKGSLIPDTVDGCKLVKVGVVFDAECRRLEGGLLLLMYKKQAAPVRRRVAYFSSITITV